MAELVPILTLNAISPSGLQRFPSERYSVGAQVQTPAAILVRSHDMRTMQIAESVHAIGRAGAGTNNIPVQEMSKRGIPVFNAPGANANAVKELVLAGMLIAARNLVPAIRFTDGLSGSDEEIEKKVEEKHEAYEIVVGPEQFESRLAEW